METAPLKQAAKEEAGKRQSEHEWVESVAYWLEMCDRDPATRKTFVTSREVFIQAIGGNDRTFDRRASLGIASALKTLGWARGVKWTGDEPKKGYLRSVKQIVKMFSGDDILNAMANDTSEILSAI